MNVNKAVFIVLSIAFILAFATVSVLKFNRDTKQEEERQEREDKMIAFCANLGMEAIDLIPPRSPKCLEPETGLMRIPKGFLPLRGGRL